MTRPCNGCGIELAAAHPGMTEDACLDAVLAQLGEARRSRPTAIEREPKRDLVTEILARGQARIAALDASPFACGACGEKLLSGDDCLVCQQHEAERQAKRERTRRALTSARIPPRYAWSTFDAPELPSRVRDRMAVATSRALAAGRIDRVVFCGNAGSGKTSLACCMLRALMDRGIACRFVTAGELAFARAHASLGSEAIEVDRAMDADVLLIDDLGEGDPITAHSAVGHVIHTRHARGLPFVITTARSVVDIDKKYGSGIARRLLEDGAKRVEVALRP